MPSLKSVTKVAYPYYSTPPPSPPPPPPCNPPPSPPPPPPPACSHPPPPPARPPPYYSHPPSQTKPAPYSPSCHGHHCGHHHHPPSASPPTPIGSPASVSPPYAPKTPPGGPVVPSPKHSKPPKGSPTPGCPVVRPPKHSKPPKSSPTPGGPVVPPPKHSKPPYSLPTPGGPIPPKTPPGPGSPTPSPSKPQTPAYPPYYSHLPSQTKPGGPVYPPGQPYKPPSGGPLAPSPNTPFSPPPGGGGNNHTPIIAVCVSLGGLFFLTFLAVGLFCLAKKKKPIMVPAAELKEPPRPYGGEAAAAHHHEDINQQEIMDPISNEIAAIGGPSSSSSFDRVSKKNVKWKPVEHVITLFNCISGQNGNKWNPLEGRSDGERKSSTTSEKGKQNKITAYELFSVDQANSTTETGASKFNTIMEPKENVLEEDGAIGDDMDAISLDEEGTALSNEGYEDRCNSCGNPLGGRSDGKRNSSSTSKKGKQKKIAACESLFSVDRANSTTKTGALKLNTIMEPKENVLEEDSALEDDMDGEGTALSDEGYEDMCNLCGNPLGGRSDGKRKSSSTLKKGKQKKIAACESLFSVDRANSTTETGASKLKTIMEPKENVLEEDSAIEDDMDAIYLDEDGAPLSDEGYEDRCNSCGNPFGGLSDEKRKSSSTSKKGKQKKIAARESFSVDRANSTTETGASKLNTIMEPKENVLEEDSVVEDDMDAVYLDGEGTALSDEGYEDRCNSCGNPLGGRSDGKRKSSSTSKKGKQKKIAARESSLSVDRANSTTKTGASKLNTIMEPKENVLEEDATIEDDMDAVYLDEEGTTLSDEGYEDRCNSCGNPLGSRIDGKRKSSSTSKKGKQKKITAYGSLFSVDRANSTTETGTSKLNAIMEPKENVLEEDSAIEDDMDAVYLDEEGAALSDEGYEDRCNSCGNPLGGRSDEKRKLSSTSKKGKQKKIADRELSFSVDRANSVAEAVIEKINTIMAPKENAGVECVEELLAAGRLQRQTPLYFFACTLLAQKQYWDMLAVMSDADEKFEWIQWQFNERKK